MYTPPAPQPTPQPAPAPQPVWYAEQQDDGVTQLGNHETQLRYIGNLNHPVVIPIHFPASGLFRIGRYDVSTGKRQCDFEFRPIRPRLAGGMPPSANAAKGITLWIWARAQVRI